VPSVRASAAAEKSLMRALISSLISEGLSCMTRYSLKNVIFRVAASCGYKQISVIQCHGQLGQFAARRSVDDQIAGADDGAAQQACIGEDGQRYFAIQRA